MTDPNTVRRVISRIERVPCEVGEGTQHYGKSVRNPARAAEVFSHLCDLPKEQFWVAVLDAKHRLKATYRVSEGTLTASLVHPREVFGPALAMGAAAILCCHNHPSGQSIPSPEDIAVTKRLVEAGKLLGVPMVDHIVVGDHEHHSLKDMGHVS